MPEQEGSLRLVARLKAEKENQATAALRQAEQRLADAEARLETVRALSADYRGRAGFVSGHVQQLRAARGFAVQLEGAVQAQMDAVEGERRLTEAARAQWVSARMQREAMDRLLEEREAAESRRRERQQQRRIDDRAMHAVEDPFSRTGVFVR